MTTQYTPILKLALPVQGELSGTWGDTVNDNITSMVEEAIAGRSVINSWTANSHTLTTADGTTAESRAMMLEFTDTGVALTGAGTVICPAASKVYICKNSSGQVVTIKTSGGTGVAVPNGATTFVFCDGTNVEECVTNIVDVTVSGTITLASGVSVSAILDEDNMASNSATALATQQSIKAYVDSQVGSVDTLAEVLANGNTTGGTNIVVTAGDSITVDTIAETTAANGVVVDGVTLKDGGITVTADVAFGDNDKAVFGAGSDLQIYHNGSNSFITDTGTGDLYIRSSSTYIQDATNASMIDAVAGGAVNLYYDKTTYATAKLATTATGIDVTGTVTADGLTVEGSTGITVRNDTVGANEPKLVFDNDTFAGANHAKLQTGNGGLQLLIESPSTSTFQNRHQILMNGGGGDDITFKLSTDNGSTYKNQLNIDNNDISFYEDTGTTASLKWTAASTSLLLTGREAARTSGTYAFEVDNSVQSANMTAAGAMNVKGYYGNSFTIDGKGDISFYDDAGAAKFFWDASTESLGIGTSSPTYALDVVSTGSSVAGFYGNSGTSFTYFGHSGGTNGAYLYNDNQGNTIIDFNQDANVGTQSLRIRDNGAERMRIDSSGNVGIGVVPESWTYFSPIQAKRSSFAGSDGQTGVGYNWYFDGAYKYIANDYALAYQQNATSGVHSWSTAASGTADNTISWSESMRIDASGNLLVGTTSNAALDGVKGMVVASNSSCGYAMSDGSGRDYLMYTTGGNWQLWDSTANVARATVDSSGNLLVGKTASNTTSTVGNELGASGYAMFVRNNDASLFACRTGTDGNIANFVKDGTTVGSIGSQGGANIYITSGNRGVRLNDGDFSPITSANAYSDGTVDLGRSSARFKDLYLSGGLRADTLTFSNLAGTERARIDSSGNLLVGCTATPSGSVKGVMLTRDLDSEANKTSTSATTGVNHFTFFNPNGAVGSISTSASATAFNTSSDQRLKENIVDAPSASDDIDAIQVRSFDWKADGSHQKYGMVAQELMTVAPEAVSGDPDSDEMMGVDYSKLVPMMMKEIQSLRARVAQLEGVN